MDFFFVSPFASLLLILHLYKTLCFRCITRTQKQHLSDKATFGGFIRKQRLTRFQHRTKMARRHVSSTSLPSFSVWGQFCASLKKLEINIFFFHHYYNYPFPIIDSSPFSFPRAKTTLCTGDPISNLGGSRVHKKFDFQTRAVSRYERLLNYNNRIQVHARTRFSRIISVLNAVNIVCALIWIDRSGVKYTCVSAESPSPSILVFERKIIIAITTSIG